MMTDQEAFEKLVEFIRDNPWLENIDVSSQPGVFRLQIGGQSPL